MFNLLFEKIKESAIAVLPMTVIVTVISVWIGMPLTLITDFGIGAILLTLGLAIFSMGAESSMMTIALEIGTFLVKKKKLSLLIIVIFLLGFLITVAEPALWVLSDQFKSVVNPLILIFTVAIGTGLFILLAILRIVFQFSLRTLMIIGYAIVFIVAGIVSISNPAFIPVSFDSGGVTTGPMAVPFIMAIGMGLSKSRGDKNADMDTFGLIGIASIGPIISVLLLGLIYTTPNAPTMDLSTTYFEYFIQNTYQMLIAIMPFVLFFAVFQIFVFKFSISKVIKVLIAFGYVYLGLVLFLTGANAGLVNLGYALGEFFATSAVPWVIVPIGMLFGFISIAAEPSVMVLNKLVEDVSAGAVTKRMMLISLSIGVSISIGLANLRVLTGISIWWIILPAYILIIGLTFITPKIFYAIAFDSGGAVSGALTSALLMPFTYGAAVGIDPSGANILLDAYGMVAFVAMTPLLTIQILGLLYKRKESKKERTIDHEGIVQLESEDPS